MLLVMAFFGGKFLRFAVKIRHKNVNNDISRFLPKAAIGSQNARRGGSTWLMRFGTIGTHRSRINPFIPRSAFWSTSKYPILLITMFGMYLQIFCECNSVEVEKFSNNR